MLSCCAGLLCADAISSERRNGTLGLLVLTRVRLLDVVLGKLSSGLVGSLSALMALIPLLMLPLLAGGITGGEALRKMLALLLALFVFLAAGLLASATQEKLAKATQWAVGFVAAICIIPFALRNIKWLHFLGWFSPLTTFWSAGELAYKAGARRDYWFSLAGLILLVCLFIAGSVFILKYRLQQPEKSTAEPVKEDPQIPEIVPEQLRWHAASKRLSPVEWIVARERAVRRSFWTSAIFIHFSQTAGYVASKMFGAPYMAYVVQILLFTIGTAFLAWGASRFLIEARSSGQLELLLTTPAPAARIILDQWRALKRLLAWPLLVMVTPTLMNLVMMGAINRGFSLGLGLIPFFLIHILIIVSAVVTICWLAMFWAWRSKTQTVAVIMTVLASSLVQVALAATSTYFLMHRLPALGSGQLLCIVYYLWLCSVARRRLSEYFPGSDVPWSEIFWFSLRYPAKTEPSVQPSSAF